MRYHKILLLLAYLLAAPVQGAEPKAGTEPLSIAVIDVQAISRKALAMKSIQKQLERLRETYQNDIARQQETLRKAEAELEAAKNKISNDELLKKAKQFNQDAARLQSSVDHTKQALEKAYTDATRQFQTELVRQVSEYAEVHGIDLVLRRSQVFLAERTLDITGDVLERMDKTIPDIKINLPSVN